MSNAFNSQILEEKLSKLNNSQQSIETLSHWCIFHRKKAKQVVETWEKIFSSSPKEQKVPFLYLANDILQNSRRKGSEFVNEFWKVLPGVLKNVYENGDDQGKSVIMRLVVIWDERKVFGSRGQGLKDDILGKEPPPLLENNGKSSHSVKVVKKDSHSIRIKLAVGGMPEKIVTAYQTVSEEHFNEDTALNKCKSVVSRVGKMEKDVENVGIQGSLNKADLLNEIREQETTLKLCVEQLESVQATRAALIYQLKEALAEQELKVELIRAQLQVAKTESEHTNNMKQRLMSITSSNSVAGQPITNQPPERSPILVPSPPVQQVSAPSQPLQPATSMASSMTSAEEEHKKAAAAVAAKLAASTSSAQMLTSVLSSLVAEEAALTGGRTTGNFTNSPPLFPMEKRLKLENPMSVPDAGNTYFGPTSAASSQPLPQTNQPSQFTPPPPPLPPPPPSLPLQQYMQTSGAMTGMVPFGFGGNVIPPPPPLSTHPVMGLARPGAPPLPPASQQQQPQSQQQQQQQPAATTGFYQSPGMSFYGQPQGTPLVPRQ
ncbi:putative CID domain-containing protein [Dioscorea sansibarensis]